MAAGVARRFEGAGLDGVIAKPDDGAYQPGKRAMIKVKHARTADCVVAGFRWHKKGPGELVGSLLLGLYDDDGALQHVGVTSSFTMAARKAARRGAGAAARAARSTGIRGARGRRPATVPRACPAGRAAGARARTCRGSRCAIERVCEVKYDHMQGDRFRHAAVFLRWRADKRPADCRYDQLEVTTPYELAKVFGAAATRR